MIASDASVGDSVLCAATAHRAMPTRQCLAVIAALRLEVLDVGWCGPQRSFTGADEAPSERLFLVEPHLRRAHRSRDRCKPDWFEDEHLPLQPNRRLPKRLFAYRAAMDGVTR